MGTVTAGQGCWVCYGWESARASVCVCAFLSVSLSGLWSGWFLVYLTVECHCYFSITLVWGGQPNGSGLDVTSCDSQAVSLTSSKPQCPVCSKLLMAIHKQWVVSFVKCVCMQACFSVCVCICECLWKSEGGGGWGRDWVCLSSLCHFYCLCVREFGVHLNLILVPTKSLSNEFDLQIRYPKETSHGTVPVL